jgi:hypothetical protein
MTYSYDRRRTAAVAPTARNLIHTLVDSDSYRMIANAMKQWGLGKLPAWDKDEFYRKGGDKAVLAYILKHHDEKVLKEWIEKALSVPWFYIPHTPKLTYRGGTLELEFTFSSDDHPRDDEVEEIKSRVEAALAQMGAEWSLNDIRDEGRWFLDYDCVVRWKEPIERLIRKYIGGLINSTGRSPYWVTWKGK